MIELMNLLSRRTFSASLLCGALCLSACAGPGEPTNDKPNLPDAQQADEEPLPTVDPGTTSFDASVLVRPSVLLGIDSASIALNEDGSVPPGAGTWQVIEFDQALLDLLQYDVIVLGEFHGTAPCHAFQMRLFEAVAARDKTIALSMEQFERDVQTALDRYLAGKLSEEAFLKVARPWGNYEKDYRPLVELAKQRGIPVIASNIPRPLASRIFKEGVAVLEQFDERELSFTAEEFILDTPEYRERFMAVMGAMRGHSDPDPNQTEEERAAAEAARLDMLERIYISQCSKDDTMAESIVRYLEANPGHKVLHTCGAFHSAGGLGTVERIARRMPGARIAVITPIHQDDPQRPAIEREDLSEGDYLLLVKPTPRPEPKPQESAKPEQAKNQPAKE